MQGIDEEEADSRFWEVSAFAAVSFAIVALILIGLLSVNLVHANWVIENLREVIGLLQMDVHNCKATKEES